MTESTEKSSEQLHREWLEHRFFRYRGCAPDHDDPMRMAGDPSLHVGAHDAPDAFAPESQKERMAREEKAKAVCRSCPVMDACGAYASSVTPEGKLAQPQGVWGGRRALERHKALIKKRAAAAAAPASRFETEQKQAVLRALAACWEPFEVAAAAGLGDDVRKANWQRSKLVSLLGLPKDVSRMRALEVAQERGLLDGVTVVADDGSVPAIPPSTASEKVRQLPALSPKQCGPKQENPDPPVKRGVRPEPLRRKFPWVHGQEALVVAVPVAVEPEVEAPDEGEGVADVHRLPVARALEAVA